jgi:hypothetical protein
MPIFFSLGIERIATKKGLERSLFVRAGTVAEFRNRHRRAQQRGVAATELVPKGKQGVVPPPRLSSLCAGVISGQRSEI